MLCKQFLTAKDKVCEKPCCFLCFGTFCLEHIVSPRFERDIVRRRATKILVATFYDQEMPVLNACIEMNFVRAKIFLKETNQYITFFRLKPAARVVLQEVAFEANQIATQSKVVFLQFHTDACRFKWSTTLIDKVLVVTKDA